MHLLILAYDILRKKTPSARFTFFIICPEKVVKLFFFDSFHIYFNANSQKRITL